jgi:hypothetical protein
MPATEESDAKAHTLEQTRDATRPTDREGGKRQPSQTRTGDLSRGRATVAGSDRRVLARVNVEIVKRSDQAKLIFDSWKI